MDLFRILFRKKTNSHVSLEKLEKIKNKMNRKIARLNQLKEKRRIKETTKRRIEEGMYKLIRERDKVIEAIKKLSGETPV